MQIRRVNARIVMLLSLSGCSAAGEARQSPGEVDRLRAHAFALAHDSMEGRNAGYRGEAVAARYIAARFGELGLEPAVTDSTGSAGYIQPFRFTPRRAPVDGRFVPQPPDMISQNVLGLMRGSHARRSESVLVISAHHDGQGVEGQTDPGRLPLDRSGLDPADTVWNGADDDASGVAVLLEVARRLAGRTPRPGVSVLFASFGAEEHGLSGYRWLADTSLSGMGGGGAEYFARQPLTGPGRRLHAVLDLEMLGRNPGVDPELYVPEGSPLERAARVATASTGFTVRVVHRVEECCNHIAFHRRGVPAGLLGVPGRRDHYHRPDDESRYLDFNRMSAVAAWVEAFVLAFPGA